MEKKASAVEETTNYFGTFDIGSLVAAKSAPTWGELCRNYPSLIEATLSMRLQMAKLAACTPEQLLLAIAAGYSIPKIASIVGVSTIAVRRFFDMLPDGREMVRVAEEAAADIAMNDADTFMESAAVRSYADDKNLVGITWAREIVRGMREKAKFLNRKRYGDAESAARGERGGVTVVISHDLTSRADGAIIDG